MSYHSNLMKGKKVIIPDGDLGISPSQKVDMSAVHSHMMFGKTSSFRPSSVRRSTVMRHRAVSSRSTVYTVQRKWRVAQRAVMTMNPNYVGNKVLRYLNLLLQFLFTYLTIWWAKRQISTRVVRKMVVCQIIGLIIMGFLFSTGGVFNISVFSKSTNEYTRDFYWAMTIVSIIVFALSVIGCIGIFRPNMLVAQVYAVVSFIFGHLIFSVVLAWYLLVILDAYLSDKYFQDSGNPPPEQPGLPPTGNSTTDGQRILNYRSDEQIFKDRLLRNYCLMLLFASIIMMSSGVLTTKLLIQVRRKQGYLFVDTKQLAQSTLPEPTQSQTHESVLY